MKGPYPVAQDVLKPNNQLENNGDRPFTATRLCPGLSPGVLHHLQELVQRSLGLSMIQSFLQKSTIGIGHWTGHWTGHFELVNISHVTAFVFLLFDLWRYIWVQNETKPRPKVQNPQPDAEPQSVWDPRAATRC